MKTKTFLSCIIISILLSSCYSVKIAAPYGKDVQLASKGEMLPVKEKKKNWYALFGAVPISNETTGKIIQENGFSKVRVETKMLFIDYVITFFTGWVTITCNTTIVEGIQAPQAAPVPPISK